MPKTAMIPTDWTTVETSIEDSPEFYHDPDSPMSKTEEKTLFLRIVETLPDGYLRDILRGIEIEVCRAIDSDFGFIVPALKQERDDLTAEVSELKRQIQALNEERDSIRRDLQRARNDIRTADTLKRDLRALVSVIREF